MIAEIGADDILDAVPAKATPDAWVATGPMVDDVIATFGGRDIEIIAMLADPSWDAVVLTIDGMGTTAVYLVTLAQYA